MSRYSVVIPLIGGVFMTEKKNEHKGEHKKEETPKRNNTGYIIGAIVVVVVILVLIFGRGGKDITPPINLADSAPEAPAVQPAEEGTSTPSADLGTKEAVAAPTAKPGKASDVSIVGEETRMGSLIQNTEEMTATSWFSGVSCKWETGEGRYDDSMTFTVINNGQKTYYLGRVRLNEAEEKNALRVSINGHGIRDTAEQDCESAYLKPGESTTCTSAVDLRKPVEGQDATTGNKLLAEATGVTSLMVFTC